jgi:hypothetical protein
MPTSKIEKEQLLNALLKPSRPDMEEFVRKLFLAKLERRFPSTRESTCGECNENLGSKAWFTLAREKGALCLACAGPDHLVILSSGCLRASTIDGRRALK